MCTAKDRERVPDRMLEVFQRGRVEGSMVGIGELNSSERAVIKNTTPYGRVQP
jgi:hypothetical protein